MKRFRLLLLAVGGVLLLLIAAGTIVFNSSFQTWATRKALASRPDLRLSVGSVNAGLQRVQLDALRLEQDGAILTVPRVEIALPVLSAGLDRNVSVSRLVAKGWVLDLSMMAESSPGSAIPLPPGRAGAGLPTAGAQPLPANPAAGVAHAFDGVFAHLELPIAVAASGVDLEGTVILPAGRGKAKLRVSGGGLAAGSSGKFDLVAEADLADPGVNRVEVRGEVVADMATPRTFTRLAAALSATARGEKFPQGVTLRSELDATRSSVGESYSVSVVAREQEIVRVTAEFPHKGGKLAGTWKLDVSSADVAPFALGEPLPTFVAVGEGVFDTDAAFQAVHAGGRLNATADRLDVVTPKLADLGELTIAADFDLAEQAGTLTVRKLEATLAGAEPIATVRALQAFEFKAATGEMRARDTGRELFGLVLHGVPVAWAKPWLEAMAISGDKVRGELVATAQAGGVSVRSTSPLTLEQMGVAQAGRALLKDVNVSLGLAADYTPKGWQVEVSGLSLTSGSATLLRVDARVGQLAGTAQPLKATGRVVSNLPAVLAQPAAEGALVLSSGDAAVDFVVSSGAQQQVQATISLRGLATVADKQVVELPDVSADIRADIDADGKIAFNLPLVLNRKERKSDLTVIGSVGPGKDKSRAIDAQVTSAQLVIDDAKLFAALAPAGDRQREDTASSLLPPWAGVHGTLGLQLAKVIYSDSFEVTHLSGQLRIDAGMVKLENLEAGLGETGRANVTGNVTFDARSAQPYGLAVDLALREFDPGPLFRVIHPDQPATVEGRFDVISKLASHGPSLSDLAWGAGGDFQLTSKGGIFRGLPVSASGVSESAGKIAGWFASAGTALGAMTGKKEYADIGSRAQAVGELARGFNPISYDQLSVIVSRDAALNTTLKNFSLITPEMRLSGQGTALHRPGSTLLEDALAMEFQLRARGRQGELLKYVGVLEPQPDDLGYFACTLPLRVRGTLGKPDTTELNQKLAELALEKSGVTDKASEIFNRVFGGGK